MRKLVAFAALVLLVQPAIAQTLVLRRTDSVRQSIVVIANPTDTAVRETLQLRESKFQDFSTLRDVFSTRQINVSAGTIDATLPPHDLLVLEMDTASYPGGYNCYDRVY